MKIFDLMLVQKIINLTSLVGWVAPGALPLGWTGVGASFTGYQVVLPQFNYGFLLDSTHLKGS